MLVKLIKPVPMVDRVMQPGEILNSDALCNNLIKTGRAEVFGNIETKNTVEAGKHVTKTTTKKTAKE